MVSDEPTHDSDATAPEVGRPARTGQQRPPSAAGAASAAAPRQMADFPEFDGIVDYIEKTTGWIWDFKNPGLIYRYYTPLTVVHTSDGDTFGRDAVIENSIKKMAAFPDIKDHVQETIWAGNDQDGYATSMRWTWTARNTGWSIYGPPTNVRVVCSGIANCLVVGEQITEEWVVYNEISLLRQLGISPRGFIADLASAGVAAPDAFGEVERLVGQGPPEELPAAGGKPLDVEDLVRRCRHDVWNRRMVGHVDRYYASNAVVHAASDRELYGPGDVKQDVLAHLAMLPDARMHVDEVYWNEDAAGAQHVAVRWTLVGTNTGQSRYCPPTGRRVRILGITHQRMVGGLVVEEWSEYSELNLMKQLLLPRAGDDAHVG